MRRPIGADELKANQLLLIEMVLKKKLEAVRPYLARRLRFNSGWGVPLEKIARRHVVVNYKAQIKETKYH